MSGLRVFSYGGGVQSTAALVLAATGRIDFRTFLFSNVGDDSEDPGTLEYVDQYAKPYAAAHGIELHELARIRRDGTVETLYQQLTKDESRSIQIPVRMANGAPGNRNCTATYKIKVIGKWLKAHGATEANKATVGVGISLDEIQRVNSRRSEPHEVLTYPLLDMDPPMRRSDCEQLIRAAGLPVPPKSSCWFCAFRRPENWSEMRRDRPDLFQRAADLERLLNERRDRLGKDHVYLTRFAKPLELAIPEKQAMLPLLDDDGASCDNGWCMT